ncbi:MAG: putative toxin-antitoxin system toxin component, PIN family [Dissulfurispiraceae bacterium]|jgi:putative PIN family toxin of toxin-antitoxin system|nr:putative toxin-antitoxin system toxin component, PIN family [Dissulfurispiraceae bacterium]
MIIAVLDSNIFISAFLFNGKQRRIIESAIEGRFRIAISEGIIRELSRVLERPAFKLANSQIKMLIAEIESISEICYPSEKVYGVCRDNDDHIILECAVAAEADFIVTGDADLLSLAVYKNISIIDSNDFMKLI